MKILQEGIMLKALKTQGIYKQGDTSWFAHDRFGMFIHWGTYSLAARHEWVQHREKISVDAYQKYFNHFDPDLYDPRDWARAAKNAGMKCLAITNTHPQQNLEQADKIFDSLENVDLITLLIRV